MNTKMSEKWGFACIDTAIKKGEWLDKEFPHGEHKTRANQYSGKVDQVDLSTMPVSKDESSQSRLISVTKRVATDPFSKRIRAIRRCGILLKMFDSQGKRNDLELRVGADPKLSKKDAQGNNQHSMDAHTKLTKSEGW